MTKGTTIMFKGIYCLSIFALVFITGCKKESQVISSESIVTQDANVMLAKTDLINYIKTHNIAPRFMAGVIDKPGNLRGKVAAPATKFSLSANPDFQFNQRVIDRAINPNDYQCGPTILDTYINQSVKNWTNDDFILFFNFGGLAFDYAYVFDNADGGQYFGANGQFTNTTNRTFKSLLRFWNIPTDILLRDAHGKIYNDVAKVKSILLIDGYPEKDVTNIAGLLKIVFGSATFRNYNHPLLTFNAFAAPADPDYNTVKKIVMGDGIQQAYDDLGYGDVSTQAILAHEYGHHVQFAKNVDFVYSPEGTRRTELMADAFSAYFMTHKRGAALNWKRVQQFLQIFYSLGDCSFKSSNHHGTPNQRMKSASFGYQLASDAQKQGHILTAEEFIMLFDAALPGILAPDAH